ncbi:flagellar basal-body MS-ring/collar protein FliF [Haloimpatiens sp. FM7315]|uniref:flagellar basal-body MS-ring/collar protein FliF n=1 Tax=Haloimpatiens sp. FM7315 TaxID=3298609 RepID=UPI00370B57A5
MNKLKELKNKAGDKWKALGKGKKVAFTIIPIGIICAIIVFLMSANSNKYGVLFSNMDDKDLGTILAKLKEEKVEYKVEGKAIKVPKDEVDTLRLEMASEVKLTNGSVGFEIFDEGKFGATDEEMKIKYKRALEGELERTVKSLPEVDDARVSLVLSDDSVFVKEATQASASLTIKLKPDKEMKKEQVKAILELFRASVKNLDKKNIEIIASSNGTTTLLTTKDLVGSEGNNYLTDTEDREKVKEKVETQLEEKVQAMLEKVYGKNNVVVKVNAALNFDAVEENKTEVAPKGTVVSEQLVSDTSNDGAADKSNSPVDNNMVSREEETNNNTSSSHKEEKKNYEISKSEKKTIKSPGDVVKISTSVLLNGEIDEVTRSSINNLVVGAIGYDKKRGDTITVEGLNFDSSIQDKAKKDLAEMEKIKEKEKRQRLITYIAIGAAVFIAALIALIVIIRRKKKANEEVEEDENRLDVTLDDAIEPKESFKPIDFETENEHEHMEKEIKNYANNKPEQVADIIKSWLAEDER